ncbi:MAG: DUF6279 family lipoprotein [Arenicellaceae bacterium]|nr:DUF6279 family lipoprotein [Arenicellaceae bacterium]
MKGVLKSMGRFLRKLAIVTMSIALLSCGANGFVIGALYERLDNEIEKTFREYADLTSEQETWLEKEVSAFHLWHRRNELPRYSGWARNSFIPLIKSQELNRSDVGQLVHDGLAFRRTFNAEFPLNKSPAILLTVSPEQLIQAREHVDTIFLEAKERRDKRTPEARVQRQVDRMTNLFKQIGWRLSSEQIVLMTNRFEGWAVGDDDQGEDWALWRNWVEELFSMLDQQAGVTNLAALKEHLRLGYQLEEELTPEEWKNNVSRLESMLHELLVGMTDAQKLSVETRMIAIADVLDDLSSKVVN